jgi:hypothetical protein
MPAAPQEITRMNDALSTILESSTVERLATGSHLGLRGAR